MICLLRRGFQLREPRDGGYGYDREGFRLLRIEHDKVAAVSKSDDGNSPAPSICLGNGRSAGPNVFDPQ